MPKHNRHGQSSILSLRDFLEIKKNLENPRDRLIIDILNYTGERVGAVLKLQVSDVYLSPSKGEPNEVITFRAATRKADTKGVRRTRQLPMHPELKLALKVYQPHLDLNSPWLFPGKDRAKSLTLQAFDLNLRHALAQAKLSHKGISTHSFRRTLITRLHEKGCDIRLIQEITGHQDLKSLQRYVEVSPQRVREAIASL